MDTEMSKAENVSLKRAFFILGPEGCGTYMLANAFVEAGCIYCDKDDVEEFLKEQQPPRIVLRRSLPHAGKWINPKEVIRQLERKYYNVEVLCILRDQYAAKRSVIARREIYTPFEYEKAMQIIGLSLDSLGGRVISYEYFVLAPDYRRSIFFEFGLQEPKEMEFYDGNKQYY